ncbi:hypothetical protein [Mycobacterium sp.]|uniref:hypothetical protein n=1 Tax=Mycobacterium sp. TaxID=1785 RepID=UPI00128296F7|nr:hypothetical protein [Mycobacterium sp.]KAA8958487.1 MAG: hypothetical protein F6Q13_15405 [Mycobacterium sp.]
MAAPASADDTTLLDTAGSDLHTADGDLSTALKDLGASATPFEKTGIDQAIALQHLSHLGDQQLLSTEDSLIAHGNPLEASVVQLLSNVFDNAIYQEAVNSLDADQALEAAVAATTSTANDPSVLADTAAAVPAPVDYIEPLPQGVVYGVAAAVTDVATTHLADAVIGLF